MENFHHTRELWQLLHSCQSLKKRKYHGATILRTTGNYQLITYVMSYKISYLLDVF